MAITAAQVEPNGWVLRLTLTAAPTSPNTDFGRYAFDVEGTPRVVLASSHPGFVKSGGMAVPGAMARVTVGTWPLRLPVNLASPLIKVIDETDLGGGSMRVRIALSETIYATDTGLSLSVLAGWRQGAPAQSGLAVTNSSVVAAPVPIFRWVLPSYEVATGVFRLSLLVASHHPVGFDPVAGVKFSVTDGTTVKTVWATALATDNSLGDNLRCHSVTIDPATATALTAGLLRCDAEVYPWLGAMRSTDPAGTRSMATLRSEGQLATAEATFVVGYDPAGSRYGLQHAFVDPVNGTATAAAAMIAASPAAAKAIAPASRPRTIMTAIAAAALVNRTLAAANGQAAATRAVDGLSIRLAAGTHAGIGTTTVSSTTTTTEIPVLIEGDPDDANPRANCIIETQAAGGALTRVTRMRWRSLTIRSGGAGMVSSATTYHFVDNVLIQGKPGNETTATAPLGTPTVVAGTAAYSFTRSRIWRTGWRVGTGNPQCGLFRANENARRASAITMVRNRYIPVAEDGTTTGNLTEGYATWVSSAFQGALEDVFLAYNDIRNVRWRIWDYTRVPAATWGGALDRTTRHVIMGNLCERTSDTGNTTDALWGFDNIGSCLTSYLVIEGNSFAGSGYSAFYNAPASATVAETNTAYSETACIRLANNATDRNASKQDDFNDPGVIAIRTAGGVPSPNGYRPHLVQCWDTHWGVNQEGNVDCSRKGTIAADRKEFFGRRSTQFTAPTLPGYADDRSESAANTGLGDYTPQPGSVLLARVVRGNSDRDWANRPRLMGGAAGALEAGDIAVAVAPAGAVHLHGAAATTAALVLPVAPAGGVMAQVTLGASVTVLAVLQPGAGLLGMAAMRAAVGIDNGAAPVRPADGRLCFTGPPTLLLPDGSVSAERTLRVRLDARMIFVNETEQEI